MEQVSTTPHLKANREVSVTLECHSLFLGKRIDGWLPCEQASLNARGSGSSPSCRQSPCLSFSAGLDNGNS